MRIRRFAGGLIVAAVVATSGCSEIHDVEWKPAEENFDEWVTSNRYIESGRAAQIGMVVTIVLVAIVVLFAASISPPGRNDTGRSLDDRPWAFLTTTAVVCVLVVAWLVALLS